MTTLIAPALIISECQRGMLEPPAGALASLADQARERAIIAGIAELAREFRARSLPVVHCTIVHRADQKGLLPNSYLGKMALRDQTMIEGTPDVEIPAELGPEPTDLVSARATGLTAFYGTDLDAMLRLQRVQTLILCGLSTNVALPGLAMDAVNRGYDVLLAEDCTAGTTTDHHAYMVQNVLAPLARITRAADVVDRLPE
ncbi:cysteine hydrolase [Gordonia humi]|uniref:Nicotinamidase-related amidase n=1 Tax=Gordonia humi TaxID=686429 RepID=A0A840ETU8_9ACTN|nr:cysteine hydrolase [Gordonia humi]MBB4135122.1 nicotinamidase-related amidase [Gordonia humi]